MGERTALFASPEFRAFWLSRGLSLFGDQLARVAIAVLVFNRTGSAAWTGATYALTYLPSALGPALGGIADRHSRRAVMVTLDVARAGLVGAMALPGVPFGVMLGLLFLVTAVNPLYEAARSAALADILPGESYATGLALMSVTVTSALLLGFGGGGAIVALTGPRWALGIDAFTFAVSAALVAARLRSRRPAASRAEKYRHHVATAVRVIFATPRMKTLVATAWLNALWMVPEALAAPYAAELHAPGWTIGLLMGAIPAGSTLGALLLARVGAERRERLLVPLGLLASSALCCCAFRPGLVVSVVLWTVCGFGTSYNMVANAAFVAAVPNGCRAQAFALVTTGMVTGEGLAAVGAGGLATGMSATSAVALAGVVGVAAFCVVRMMWRLRPSQAEPAAQGSGSVPPVEMAA